MGRETKCPKCTGKMIEKSFRINGTFVPGKLCLSCGEIEIEDNLSELLLFNKLKKEEYKSTVGLLGNSLIIRIPKDYSDAYKLGKGQEVQLAVSSEKEFVIKLPAKHAKEEKP